MGNTRTRAPLPGAALLATCLLVFLVLGLARVAPAQQLDCGDVDHDCHADRYTESGIKKAGATLVRCVKEGVDPCDLGLALARVSSPDCRTAIECELRDLFARIGDGSTSCVQGLRRELEPDAAHAGHLLATHGRARGACTVRPSLLGAAQLDSHPHRRPALGYGRPRAPPRRRHAGHAVRDE